MITIVAEKPSVAAKIAAALDCIKTANKTISFEELGKNDKAVKAYQFNNHHFD